MVCLFVRKINPSLRELEIVSPFVFEFFLPLLPYRTLVVRKLDYLGLVRVKLHARSHPKSR
jgi:hypothetical protein